MMHLVCLTNGPQVKIIGASENFYALVNEYVMNKKVSDTIESDSHPQPKEWSVQPILCTKKNQDYPGYSENHKEPVVPLKMIFRILLMVIPVQ